MDEQLLLLVNGHHTAFLDSFMWLLTQKTIWIPLYCSMLYVVWRNYGWRGALQILVMIALGMLVTDWANSQFLRPAFGRLRPNNPENPVFSLLYRVNGFSVGPFCQQLDAHIYAILLASRQVDYYYYVHILADYLLFTGVFRLSLSWRYPWRLCVGSPHRRCNNVVAWSLSPFRESPRSKTHLDARLLHKHHPRLLCSSECLEVSGFRFLLVGLWTSASQ